MEHMIITYLGVSAVAGLSWGRSPKGLSENKLGVRWGETFFAPVTNGELIGYPSLLSLLFAARPDAEASETLLFALADEEQGIFWGALVAGGKPVAEPEHVFESEEHLLDWIQSEQSQSGLHRLVLGEDLVGKLSSEVPIERLERADDVAELATVTGKAARFDVGALLSAASLDKMKLVQLAVIAVGAATLLWVYFPKAKVETDTTTQIVTIQKVRNEAQFLTGCAEAFEGQSSIGIGWVRKEEGCWAPGMGVVAGLPQTGAVAYQAYTLKPGFDPAIARAVARSVTRNTGMEISGSDTEVTVSKTINADLVSAASVPEAPIGTLVTVLEEHFLGLARSVKLVGENAEVTLWGSFADALPVILELSWAEVKELRRNDALLTVVLGPKRVEAIPVGILSQLGETS